jgi:hypothetical protein
VRILKDVLEVSRRDVAPETAVDTETLEVLADWESVHHPCPTSGKRVRNRTGRGMVDVGGGKIDPQQAIFAFSLKAITLFFDGLSQRIAFEGLLLAKL